MKKILALVLAIIMMAAIAVPAFAEDYVTRVETDTFVGGTENAATSTPAVKITYGVAQTYILNIPADIALAPYASGSNETNNNLRATSSISATNVKINGKETLNVTATSQNNWLLKDENEKSVDVNYFFKAGETEGTYNIDGKTAAVLTVATPTGNAGVVGSEDEYFLEFTSKGTAQEGIYSDFITFHVSITESNP